MAIQIARIGKLKIPRAQSFYTQVEASMMSWAQIVERDYARTTRTWETEQPRFTRRRSGSWNAGYFQVSVYTTSARYYWVDQGTNPHYISARRVPYLRYQTRYKRATRPGIIGSRTHGKYGPWRRTREVRHSGIVARNFTATIAERRRGRLITHVQRAANQWMQAYI